MVTSRWLQVEIFLCKIWRKVIKQGKGEVVIVSLERQMMLVVLTRRSQMEHGSISSHLIRSYKTPVVKFVQRHRHDFREPLSKYTSLCSAHFESSCYERKYIGLLISESKMQFILRKGAVPTIDSVSSEREEILTERDKRQVSLVYSLRINSYFVRRYMYMGRDKRQVSLVYRL